MEVEGRLILCVCVCVFGQSKEGFFQGIWTGPLGVGNTLPTMVRDEGGDGEGERAFQGQLSHSVEVEEPSCRGGCAGHTTGQL